MQTKLASRLKLRKLEDPSFWKNQKDLARKLETNQATVSRLMRGKVLRLSEKTRNALGRLLDLDPNQVLVEAIQSDNSLQTDELNSLNVHDFLLPVANDLPVQLYFKNLKREFVWVNKPMLTACNCTKPDELLGKRDEDLFEDPHLTRAREDDESVLRGNCIINQVEFETWVPPKNANAVDARTKPSRLRIVVTTKKPLYRDGKIIGLFGFTKEFIVELPNRTGKFFKNNKDPWNFAAFTEGIFYKDHKRNHIWCDEPYARNFPSQGRLGHFKHVYKPDRIRIAHALNDLNDSRSNPTEPATAWIDFRALKEGRYAWYRATAISYGEPGKKTIICGHQIISEKDASNALTQGLLQSLPNNVLMYVKDDDGHVCYMNQTMLNLLKLNFSDVLGKSFDSIGLKQVLAPSIDQSRNPKNGAESNERSSPEVTYEKLETPRGDRLTLTSLKIRVDSPALPTWMPIIGKSNEHESAAKTVKPSHTLHIAWKVTNNEGLNIDQVLQSMWHQFLIESHDVAIYIKSVKDNCKYIYANQAFADRLKKNVKAIINKTAEELFANEPAMLEIIQEEDQQLANKKRVLSQVFRKRKGDTKNKFWYEFSTKFAISDLSGAVKYILGISRRISDKEFNELTGSK